MTPLDCSSAQEGLPAPAVHLDDAVVQAIARFLVQGESPGNTLLHVLSMCGVNKQWRSLARELAPETPVAFDGMDNTLSQGQATLARFRKLGSERKEQLFVAAAALLKGYANVTLSGDCINSMTLERMAATNGRGLQVVKLVGTSTVSDAGLAALTSAAPGLIELHLEDLGKGVTGSFLPAALDNCRQLEALHIEGAAGMNWASMQWWPVASPHDDAGQNSTSISSGTDIPALLEEPAAAYGAADAGTDGGAGAAAGAGSAQVLSPAVSGTASDASSEEVLLGGLSISSSGGAVAMEAVGASPVAGSPPEGNEGGSLSSDEAEAEHPRSPSMAATSSSSRGSAGGSRLARCSAALASTSISSGGCSARSAAECATSGSSSDGTAGPDSANQCHQNHHQQQQQHQHQSHHQQQPQLQQGHQQQRSSPHRPRPPLSKLTRLHVTASNVDCLQPLLQRLPALAELELDGRARNIQVAAMHCQCMRRMSYLVSSQRELETALWSFTGLPHLRALELVVRNMALATDHMKVLGMLPVQELRIDSYVFKQQPTLARPQYSHIDNEGVKGLVDSLCMRLMGVQGMRGLGGSHNEGSSSGGDGGSNGAPEMQPLKLSLCGATALSHEAVSALLRLPILTELDIGGCCRISAMDKMRLVAKVKAGRELLEGGRQGGQGSGYPHALRFPGLF